MFLVSKNANEPEITESMQIVQILKLQK